MLKALILGVFLAFAGAGVASAQSCPAYPYTLMNGSTADASQVMGNFNSVLNCVNTVRGSASGGVALPAGPTSTTSFTMVGVGVTFTPKSSGTAMVCWSGGVQTTVTTAGSGIKLNIAIGAGSPPTNGAAATGSVIGFGAAFQLPAAATAASNVFQPISQCVVDGGLTVGTTYWFDLQQEAVLATGVQFNYINISVIEQ